MTAEIDMIIDLHTHTNPLSYDSDLSADDLIVAAKEAGLDGICLTEHDAFWSESEVEALRRKHQFPVFAGAELNTEEEHLIVFGLKQWLIGMSRAEFVIEKVREFNGAVIIAHPFRRKLLRGHDDPGDERFNRELDKACANPLFSKVDALEIQNSHGNERENSFSAELTRRLNQRTTGGTDAHEIADVGHAATYFERDIRSLDDLIIELKAGRFRALSPREIMQKLRPSKAKRRSEEWREQFEKMRQSGLYTEFGD
jgi:predicted metal-dependent phosphoesterase TrpH